MHLTNYSNNSLCNLLSSFWLFAIAFKNLLIIYQSICKIDPKIAYFEIEIEKYFDSVLFYASIIFQMEYVISFWFMIFNFISFFIMFWICYGSMEWMYNLNGGRPIEKWLKNRFIFNVRPLFDSNINSKIENEVYFVPYITGPLYSCTGDDASNNNI